jgi:hypothetical protein
MTCAAFVAPTGSAFMHALRRGQEVQVTQPLQNFPMNYGKPGYVLAAGGIGITALVGMGKALKARGADYRFVYGARSRNLMAFVDELAAEHRDRMDLRVDHEGGSLDVDELVAGVPAGGELYVCGPTPMLDAIKAAWARSDATRRTCGSRPFGSSGRFAAEAFRGAGPEAGPGDHRVRRRVDAGGARGVRRGHDVRLPPRRVRPLPGQGARRHRRPRPPRRVPQRRPAREERPAAKLRVPHRQPQNRRPGRRRRAGGRGTARSPSTSPERPPCTASNSERVLPVDDVPHTTINAYSRQSIIPGNKE